MPSAFDSVSPSVQSALDEKADSSKVTDFIARFGDGSGNDQYWIGFQQFIPYDPSKTYRLTVVARKIAGTGTAWAGFNGANSDGTVYFNRFGANTKDSQHYGALISTNYYSHWEIGVQPQRWYGPPCR